MRDVPIAARPIAVHGAVLERQAHALVGRSLRELAPDGFELRQARLDRLAPHASGEAGDRARPEQVRVVDQRLPSFERLPVELVVLERIAEHAERVDDDVGVADRLAKLVCELGQVLVHGLPEERLDAFKAELDELANGSRRIGRACADHRANSDVQELAHLGLS